MYKRVRSLSTFVSSLYSLFSIIILGGYVGLSPLLAQDIELVDTLTQKVVATASIGLEFNMEAVSNDIIDIVDRF